MRILVTGGSGYLGTHIRRYFDAEDLSRRAGRNILDPDDALAVKDFDVVIHLAAQLDKAKAATEEVFRVNVEGTANLLRNVRKGAVFIFASTKDVYGRFADNYKEVPESCSTNFAGQSPLEWSKLIAERYVEYYANAFGFRSCIFRLSSVYAPPSDGNTPNFVGHFAEAINMGEPLALAGGGRPVRDLLHVDDLARACSAFSDSVIGHGLYNLGGGSSNALSLKELVTRMEDVSGLQAVITDAGTTQPVPLNYVSDISLAAQELGWKPTITLDEGLSTLFG